MDVTPQNKHYVALKQLVYIYLSMLFHIDETIKNWSFKSKSVLTRKSLS